MSSAKYNCITAFHTAIARIANFIRLYGIFFVYYVYFIVAFEICPWDIQIYLSPEKVRYQRVAQPSPRIIPNLGGLIDKDFCHGTVFYLPWNL